MAKSPPEKLARALRANLKRRKGPTAQYGLEDGRAAKRAQECSPARATGPAAEKPLKSPG